MMYRCDVCGCYLDAGEGRICDECEMERESRRKRMERRREALMEADGGQIEMRLQEVV